MAQPGTNPKIEELQFRLKTDPKSRLFFPLAEELRKVGQLQQAEQVLHTGLVIHPMYLSAWVSLGRVFREEQKNDQAVEALSKALQLDPGNVVAARLLADAYLGLGQKLEALKKYKLVYALLPADEELEALIERLDREINPIAPVSLVEGEDAFAPPLSDDAFAAPAETQSAPQAANFANPRPFGATESAEDSPFADTLPEQSVSSAAEETPFAQFESPFEETLPNRPRTAPADEIPHQPTIETPLAADAAGDASPLFISDDNRILDEAATAVEHERDAEVASGDDVPMAATHAESPFEEPASYTAAAMDIEQPAGFHVESAPLPADVATTWEGTDEPAEPPLDVTMPIVWPQEEASSASQWAEPEAAADVFAPAEAAAPAAGRDLTNTTTMADLYVKQGLVSEARKIYENILQRDPDNAAVRAKIDALEAQPHAGTQSEARNPKVAKLEDWLAKVARREESRV